MPIAFLFVVAELGFEEDVLHEIGMLPDVKEAHLVYGMYDIMVKIEALSPNKVDELVAKIRKLDKIRSTQTLIAATRTGSENLDPQRTYTGAMEATILTCLVAFISTSILDLCSVCQRSYGKR